MPVTCDADVVQKKLQMIKSDFNKFMANEKKKEKFNMKLFEHSNDYHKDRIELIELLIKVDSYEPMINSLKERKIEGNLETALELVRATQREISHFNILRQNTRTTYNELYKKFALNHTHFLKLSQIAHIEDKLYSHAFNQQQREKEDRASKQHQNFLKLLDNLPDDLLKVIQSYFTYETRAALLVHTYNPIRMFCALNKSGLQKTLTYINKKYAPVSKQHSPAWKKSPELHTKMIRCYRRFYNREKTKYILSTSDLKLYLRAIFFMFHRYQQHQWCFDLYRAIIICKK